MTMASSPGAKTAGGFFKKATTAFAPTPLKNHFQTLAALFEMYDVTKLAGLAAAKRACMRRKHPAPMLVPE